MPLFILMFRDILEGKFVRFKKYGKTNWDELYLGVASHKLHKIGQEISMKPVALTFDGGAGGLREVQVLLNRCALEQQSAPDCDG